MGSGKFTSITRFIKSKGWHLSAFIGIAIFVFLFQGKVNNSRDSAPTHIDLESTSKGLNDEVDNQAQHMTKDTPPLSPIQAEKQHTENINSDKENISDIGEVAVIDNAAGINLAFWTWLSIGSSYSNYKQETPGLLELNFEDTNGIRTAVNLGAFLQDANIGLEFSYINTPGAVKSSSSLIVNDGDKG